MPVPKDPLDSILDRWKEPDDPPPGLRREVWRRIEGRRPGLGLWHEVDSWLSRPPFATLFVVSCALLGLFLAEVRVNRQQREHSQLLARSYLQLIDPLLRADPVERAP